MIDNSYKYDYMLCYKAKKLKLYLNIFYKFSVKDRNCRYCKLISCLGVGKIVY